MDLKQLNALFDDQGNIRNFGLPDGVVGGMELIARSGRAVVHEFHLGETVIFIPDGGQSRQLGESYVEQSVGGSLVVQARVNELQADESRQETKVLIYTPNSDDANLAATIAYANGIDAVVVDGGNPIRIGELGDFGREFTARGGELRAGGRVTSIREDLGLGSPTSVVDIELERGSEGVHARGSVMGAKDITASANEPSFGEVKPWQDRNSKAIDVCRLAKAA